MKTEQLTDSINAALGFALANTHTITIAKITAVNDTTINCRPVINRKFRGEEKPLPEFIQVPPIFMSGGTSYTAHPIAVGDYCLLLISERCYDNWYNGTDYVLPVEDRMFDYSDAFALVGIQNKAGAITIPDVITQIGDAYMMGNHVHDGDLEHNGNTTHEGNYTQTGDLTRTGLETVTGDRTQTGSITTTDKIESATTVVAPILSGVLTGVGGAAPVIPQPVTATELHADDGYTGEVVYLKDIGGTTGTITFVDGICTGAT